MKTDPASLYLNDRRKYDKYVAKVRGLTEEHEEQLQQEEDAKAQKKKERKDKKNAKLDQPPSKKQE